LAAGSDLDKTEQGQFIHQSPTPLIICFTLVPFDVIQQVMISLTEADRGNFINFTVERLKSKTSTTSCFSIPANTASESWIGNLIALDEDTSEMGASKIEMSCILHLQVGQSAVTQMPFDLK
jgi:hypothetical protein